MNRQWIIVAAAAAAEGVCVRARAPNANALDWPWKYCRPSGCSNAAQSSRAAVQSATGGGRKGSRASAQTEAMEEAAVRWRAPLIDFCNELRRSGGGAQPPCEIKATWAACRGQDARGGAQPGRRVLFREARKVGACNAAAAAKEA